MKSILFASAVALIIVAVAGAGAYARYGGCWDGGPAWSASNDAQTEYGTPAPGWKSGAYSGGERRFRGPGYGRHGMWGRGYGHGRGFWHHWGW